MDSITVLVITCVSLYASPRSLSSKPYPFLFTHARSFSLGLCNIIPTRHTWQVSTYNGANASEEVSFQYYLTLIHLDFKAEAYKIFLYHAI